MSKLQNLRKTLFIVGLVYRLIVDFLEKGLLKWLTVRT